MDPSISLLISEVPIFAALSDEELMVVEKHLTSHEVAAKDVVFKEGSHGNYMCFVVEGELDVIKRVGADKQATLVTLGKGQSVGEMAMIDGLIRSATVRAKTDSLIVVMKRGDFDTLLEKYPRIGVKILRGLARMLSMNLRKTSNDLTKLMLSLT